MNNENEKHLNEHTYVEPDATSENQEMIPAGSIDEFLQNEDEHPHSKAGRFAIWVVIILVLAVVGFGIFRVVSNNLNKSVESIDETINIRVASAELASLANTSLLTGTLEAVDEVAVVPKVAGEVTKLNVSLGSKVSKGTVLFELDSTQAKISVDQAALNLSDAQTNLARMETLYEEGAIPLQTLEQSRSQVTLAQGAYNTASDAFSYYTIKSPISGYVTSVNTSVGTLASQASPAVTISNINELEINTTVSENLINKMSKGDAVNVYVKSFSEEPIPGVITALSPAPAMGTLTYPMIVTLSNGDEALKPGMFAEIVISSDQVNDVVAVPSKAVLLKMGVQYVVTVDDENNVIFNEVVTGLDNGEMVEIISGISYGDRIVIEGQSYLLETSKVNILE